MRSATNPALPRRPAGSRGGASLVVVALGLIAGGCARDRHEITPTTLGTDLRRIPRGTMTPFPWPGVDLVKDSPPSNRIDGRGMFDPEAATASGGALSR